MTNHFVLRTSGTPLLMPMHITKDTSMKIQPGKTSRTDKNCVDIIMSSSLKNHSDCRDDKYKKPCFRANLSFLTFSFLQQNNMDILTETGCYAGYSKPVAPSISTGSGESTDKTTISSEPELNIPCTSSAEETWEW